MGHTRLLPSLKMPWPKKRRWKRYASDSLLALGSISLLTVLVSLFHLYAKIPDSLLLYLLVVLALASIRGRYAALLAALVAFFSFDFLFVPPLYSVIITKFSDFVTLIVFFVSAIITGQLTSALRRYAAQASRRERETRILYNLVRTTNHEADLDHQLQIFAQAVIDVFSPWGVRDSMLLMPDAGGKLNKKISASQPCELISLSLEEEEKAALVLLHGNTVDIQANLFAPALSEDQPAQIDLDSPAVPCTIRLIPLQREQQVLGVLRLLVEQHSPFLTFEQHTENGQALPQAVFFRTFLEQAVALIERGRLQRESLHITVLQQTDTLRKALLSSVSHDLRTPLSAIMAAATGLQQQETPWDEETRQSMALLIEQEARRLNRLVENLLDMSRIEGGALSPKKVWYPLDELVRDALGRMYLLLQGRPLQLTLSDNLPPVELDQIQIDQVLTNLIENAIRYTPAGSPLEISIEADGNWIQTKIADRGPGVPLAERTRIFDKFYRVQRTTSALAPAHGSGLGLAICQGLIEAHGGQIWVEPREGGGALFCFTLPLTKMEEFGFDEYQSAHSRR
jgi:two-component system, OmpR family, sensor histidine kinase KdpD